MFNLSFFRLRYFAVLLLALILAVSAYAFAAANTVPTSGAGDGQAAISGYTITNVTYDTRLAPDTDPTTIDQVSFDMTPQAGAGAATEVFVKLSNAAGASWYSCTAPVAPATQWTCSIGGAVTTLAANELRVVAAQ